MTDLPSSPQSPPNKSQHPLKGKSPWAGLTTRERNRRIKKMVASARANREARDAEKVAVPVSGIALRRKFDDAQKAAYVAEVDALVGEGMLIKDACAKVGIGRTQYNEWRGGERRPRGRPPKANGKHLPVVINRPPAHMIEVLDMPAPRNGHRTASPQDRMDRLAALIIAVEKLL